MRGIVERMAKGRRNALIGLALAVLMTVGGVFLWREYSVEITYRSGPVLGDEIVLKLGKLADPDTVRDQFAISPDVLGELAWLPDEREFRFLPMEPLAPEVTYRIYIGTRSWLRASVHPGNVVFAFTTGRGAVEPILVPNAPHERYIDVNLATEQVTLVENGKPFAVYPVAAQGSPWTSPTRQGEFSVLSKEENHLSSLFNVWMPLSMRYSGPYFIHAWPYWPGGRRIQGNVSGGCIRMYDHDMREVYDWAQVGDPFVVHETPGKTPVFTPETLSDGDLVQVEGSADVYVLKQGVTNSYKRHVMTDDFGEWYSHLKKFWPRVKVVLDAASLEPYLTSRWVMTEQTQENGHRYLYEINAPGVKHLMRCGDGPGDSKPPEPWKCEGSWEAYGWPKDELYTASDQELAAYANGSEIVLPTAPWLAP